VLDGPLVAGSPGLPGRWVDAIGTVSKTLFGTMDADDEKIINEQLNLLANN